MRAINCRVLKVGRIYISQGTFLPLFVREIWFTKRTSFEFIHAIARTVRNRALSEISKSTVDQTT